MKESPSDKLLRLALELCAVESRRLADQQVWRNHRCSEYAKSSGYGDPGQDACDWHLSPDDEICDNCKVRMRISADNRKALTRKRGLLKSMMLLVRTVSQ